MPDMDRQIVEHTGKLLDAIPHEFVPPPPSSSLLSPLLPPPPSSSLLFPPLTPPHSFRPHTHRQANKILENESSRLHDICISFVDISLFEKTLPLYEQKMAQLGIGASAVKYVKKVSHVVCGVVCVGVCVSGCGALCVCCCVL